MKRIKNTFFRISGLRNLVRYFYRKINNVPKFTTSSEYWEAKYKSGGNSGPGSYNNLAEYKAYVINNFVRENNVETVIEFGSGDGHQLKYFDFKSYIGFDVSQSAVNKCRNIYKFDSTKRFEVLEAYNKEKADLVLSLDVIFHLIEDATFFDYMEKLFSSSNKYVIIYSSNFDEHENNNVAAHVRHRNFTNWIGQNYPNFKLIDHIPNKYPFNGNIKTSSYSDFYVFQMND